MQTPDPETGTREEFKALLMLAYADHVALEKKYIEIQRRYQARDARRWQYVREHRAEMKARRLDAR